MISSGRMSDTVTRARRHSRTFEFRVERLFGIVRAEVLHDAAVGHRVFQRRVRGVDDRRAQASLAPTMMMMMARLRADRFLRSSGVGQFRRR